MFVGPRLPEIPGLREPRPHEWYGQSAIFDALGILLLLLMVPVFPLPLAALDVDMIFGIIIISVVEFGLIAPPIGMNVFTVKAVVPDGSLPHILSGVTLFIPMMLLGLILLPRCMASRLGCRI